MYKLFHTIAYIVVKSIIPDIAYHKARIQFFLTNMEWKWGAVSNSIWQQIVI